MIPNKQPTATIENSLGGRRIKMGIAQESIPFIMQFLTDLYSDQELACIREYSTNAYDAHLDAGQKRPIEVSTPTPLDPFLTIKDYGVGMDEVDIEFIYSLYGISSKREQEDRNGSMGFGAKAALSLTPSFNVTGIKEGVKTLVSVTRDEDGGGSQDIVFVGRTDESNGVEIKIPASAHGGMKSKAENFFQFWAPGTVLLNGQEPERALEKITEHIYLYEGDKDVVVMGNVPYPLSHQYRINKYGGRSVALFVEMGGADQVSFTPSREGLMYNDATTEVLDRYRAEYEAIIIEHLTNRINDTKTYIEAYRIMEKYRQTYSSSMVSRIDYKGDRLVNFVLKSGNENAIFTRWHAGKRRNAVERGEIYLDNILDSDNRVVVNYRNAKGVSAPDKARLKEYFSEHVEDAQLNTAYWGGSRVYLTSDSSLPDKRCEGVTVYDWKDILRLTRSPRAGGRGSGVGSMDGEYHVYNGFGFDQDSITNQDDIVYWSDAASADWFNSGPSSDMLCEAARLFPDKAFVKAGANRHAKLTRTANSAVRWAAFESDVITALANESFARLTDNDFKVLAYQEVYEPFAQSAFGIDTYSTLAQASHMYPESALDKIDDPVYAETLRMVTAPKPTVGYASKHPDFKKSVDAHKPHRVLFVRDDYPLLNHKNITKNIDECVEYINYKYAKRMENQDGS